MGKSKFPFKTNVKSPAGKRSSVHQVNEPVRVSAGFGSWEVRRDRPIKAVVVDPKKERMRKLRWLGFWIVLVPSTVMLLLWFSIFVYYLFHP